MKYHHVGIPTQVPREGEVHVESLGIHVVGFETHPYGVEWMRFDDSCPVPELVKTVAHVAFVVEDLQAAIAGKRVIIAPNRPSDGVTVAFVEEAGAPIELMQFDDPSDERARSCV